MPRIFHIAVEVPDIAEGCSGCIFLRLGTDAEGNARRTCSMDRREVPLEATTTPEWCTAETCAKNAGLVF